MVRWLAHYYFDKFHFTYFTGHFAFNDYIDLITSAQLMPMAESVYDEQTIHVSKKTWPYMYLMNSIILNIQNGGIGKFLENNASVHTVGMRLQNNLQREIDITAQIVPLTVDHILEVLFLLWCGYLLALMAFLFEIVSAKKKILAGNYCMEVFMNFKFTL